MTVCFGEERNVLLPEFFAVRYKILKERTKRKKNGQEKMSRETEAVKDRPRNSEVET